MIAAVKRAFARRMSVREEGARLARCFGAEGAEVAFLRSKRPGLAEDERLFWRAVSRFAWRRHADLQVVDRVVGYLEARRQLRRRA